MRRSTLTALLLTTSLAAAATGSPLRGQDVVLDEGEFTLHLNGEAAGTEAFVLRRVGGGDEAKIWATATVELDEGTDVVAMRPVLQTAADRNPLGYQNKITGQGEVEVQIGVADRRFVAMIKSAAGERERELRATSGAVFLEGTVAHQYYFLPDPPAGGSMNVAVVIPRSGEQVSARLSAAGTETLRIAGRQVQAEKLLLTVSGEERQIWRDDEGRVLRLVIPARNFRAERAGI